MITIKNWDKLTRMFRSQIDIGELDEYYRITLSRISPPQHDHPHKDEYLMLCGVSEYWLNKKELENVDSVYEAIVDVVVRHNLKVRV
jgi:hypothetical protein